MLVVVGGHSRNIGKTSVVAGLIRRTKNCRWTAVKITQYGHGVCARAGQACGCEADPECSFALNEEYEPRTTDSGRFLAAGAERSLWLRAPAGQLAGAATTIGNIVRSAENVIIESNSVVEFVRPDVFLMLLDFSCDDFKASSLRLMGRADAFLMIDRGINAPMWADVSRGLWDSQPRFLVRPPRYVSAEVLAFVNSRRPAPTV